MQKFKLEYVFSTSSNLLFNYVSTPDGLSEWFADDVILKEGHYTFKWKDFSQTAKYKIDNRKLCAKFDWIEDEKFLEFRIEMNNITKDLILYITECADDSETLEDATDLWDNQILALKRKLGLN